MQNKTITKLKIPQLNEFDFQIKYSETNQKNHWHEIDLHTHNEFELYINLSGDVSFLVENNLYDLSRGDVIIARPGEYHHCIYRSDAPHKLFWILFDSKKNNTILDFLREDFCENFISPKNNLRDELLDLCYLLHNNNLTDEDKIYTFFRIFAILKKSKNNTFIQQSALPQELRDIINYIDNHICEELTVSDIAKFFYSSQSTLERKFKKTFNITPLEFIKRKKLTLAAKMLQEGHSVLTAGTYVGYNDNSYFIKIFKQYYGLTPNHYKKIQY